MISFFFFFFFGGLGARSLIEQLACGPLSRSPSHGNAMNEFWTAQLNLFTVPYWWAGLAKLQLI